MGSSVKLCWLWRGQYREVLGGEGVMAGSVSMCPRVDTMYQSGILAGERVSE